MKRGIFIALGFAMLPVAAHAAVAPAAKLLTSDTARLGEPFAVDFFNWRISKVEWLADTTPFAKAIDAESQDGSGTLAITATLKNSSNDSAHLPSPNAQAIFKDGSATDESGLDAYTPAGKVLAATYQPGAGTSAVYVLKNVPRPTESNPITKIVFRQSFTGLKPELIRLPQPRVITVD